MEIHRTNIEQRQRRRRYLLATLGTSVLILTGVTVGMQYNRDSNGNLTTSERPSPEYQYPLHENVTATVFWVGEDENTSNDFIHNRSSAWMSDWVTAYGGIDNRDNRCGYMPCDFTPKENPFYFALPFSDYDENGLRPAEELSVVPWYDGKVGQGKSLLKNRWIEITFDGKKAYGQWEDVGPFADDDAAYVFGADQPKEQRAGLDMSPALADYLNVDGRATVNWRFVDEQEVPDGEWKKIITRSDPQYK